MTRSCKPRASPEQASKQASQHTPCGHTPCVPCGGWRGAAPPLTLRFRPATRAAGGEVLQPPSPVAGATAERSPVVADDPADVILDGPPAGSLARDRHELEAPPVGGFLADWVAAVQVMLPPQPVEPEKRSHGHSGRFGGGLAEFKVVGSPVTHELNPRRGRSTPGFGLPAEDPAPTLRAHGPMGRDGHVGGSGIPRPEFL